MGHREEYAHLQEPSADISRSRKQERGCHQQPAPVSETKCLIQSVEKQKNYRQGLERHSDGRWHRKQADCGVGCAQPCKSKNQNPGFHFFPDSRKKKTDSLLLCKCDGFPIVGTCGELGGAQPFYSQNNNFAVLVHRQCGV